MHYLNDLRYFKFGLFLNLLISVLKLKTELFHSLRRGFPTRPVNISRFYDALQWMTCDNLNINEI